MTSVYDRYKKKVKIFGGVFMSLPIIIDTDPGIDDAAIALALSHTKFDVKMISTVNGNVGVEKPQRML